MSTTRIDIYSLGVGNTLGGCALQPDASNAQGLCLQANLSIHSFSTRCWQHARGLRLELASIRPCVDNTLGGFASHWHLFARR
jgi:hypothetical protein